MPETAIPVTDQPRKSMIKSLHPLTQDDVLGYLKAKKSKLECPFCGTSHWKVDVPAKEGFAEVPLSATSSTAMGTFYYQEPPLSLIVLVCYRCAFVRTHSAQQIAEWKGTWVVPPAPEPAPTP